MNDHFLNKHVTPMRENHFARNALRLGELTPITLACVRLSFFTQQSVPANCCWDGIFFLLFCRKDGSAYLVATAASGWIIPSTAPAIHSGRLWVTMRFDIADSIRAIQPKNPSNETTALLKSQAS